ncbi:MAG: hypothetical protein PHQ05_10500 [Sterolibacterium sp.]|nr:hypothetical protein [Sterolibacterium sp.]
MQPTGLRLGLNHRIAVGLSACRQQGLTIEGDFRTPLARFAPSLGFDSEYTARTDDDVIHVEAFSLNVMEDLIALFAQPLQELPYGLFTFFGLAQCAQFRPSTHHAEGGISYGCQCKK